MQSASGTSDETASVRREEDDMHGDEVRPPAPSEARKAGASPTTVNVSSKRGSVDGGRGDKSPKRGGGGGGARKSLTRQDSSLKKGGRSEARKGSLTRQDSSLRAAGGKDEGRGGSLKRQSSDMRGLTRRGSGLDDQPKGSSRASMKKKKAAKGDGSGGGGGEKKGGKAAAKVEPASTADILDLLNAGLDEDIIQTASEEKASKRPRGGKKASRSVIPSKKGGEERKRAAESARRAEASLEARARAIASGDLDSLGEEDRKSVV